MSSPRRVLVLGAGRVSGPVYEDLSREEHIQITAVSPIKSELDHVKNLCPAAKLECVDVSLETHSRDRLICDSDLVICLLPYPMIPDIARICLLHKKHLLSASYKDETIQKLHEEVLQTGLIFLTEVGLDPGIDHMLAMRTFDDIRNRGGEVTSYKLWCGGLPAPEHADNPLKYKFSWYPRGALWACWRGGGFKKSGKVFTLPIGPALLESAEDLDFTEEFKCEGFPNIYHPEYLSAYKIETADTFIRGTLRYRGFSAALLGLTKLGLFDENPNPLLKTDTRGMSWRRLLCNVLELPESVADAQLQEQLKKILDEKQIEVVKSIGLLSEKEIIPKATPLDTLAFYLERRPEFMFSPRERDVVVMHIDVEGTFPNASKENRDVNMIVYGEIGKHSAMAKTVGHTIASAAMLIINDKISERGVIIPTSPGIYKPLLSDLERKGIVFTDSKR